MKASQKCLDLIKRFEGLKLTAYLCPANILTIGYGHTKSTRAGMKITEQEADRLLQEDVAVFEKGVESILKVPVSQGQFDALVCFAFNVGIGNLQKSTLLKKLNSGDTDSAADEFLCWNKAGGKALSGLTSRRKAERELFIS